MSAATQAYPGLKVRTTDGVLRLTLDRPQCLNAIDAAMGAALVDVVTGPATSPEVRAVLIDGAGRAFCAGADISSGTQWVSAATMSEVVQGLIDLPKPVIAAVQGAAAGVGCSIALAADLAILSTDAYLLLAFTKIGLMPDGGATELLAASVGRARALRACLTAERLPAHEALAAGAVARVTDPELLAAEADRLARQLAAGATRSLALTKAAINTSSVPTVSEAMSREATWQEILLATPDFAEGQRAFEGRRAPRFAGT